MEKEIAIRIGRNIARARKSVHRTQADLAEKLGIETGSLSRMERGVIMPGIPMLDRIADELGVALWQLLGTASSSSVAMAENIVEQLEKLNQAERLFLLEEIERWVAKLSSVSPVKK
ncbi:MAG: helix-turn-helix domain-containing protein [Alistipes senegalensis]|nr:helix-turn-helix domain-containing protein [Oxalobacter formigenes]MCM1280248.1 helix-turn-helix domain-containing protein [Alistipes senegalensis]